MNPSRIRAVLMAAGLATGLIVAAEGVEYVGYREPVGVVTSCAGHTKTAVLGKKYTEAECREQFMADVIEHGAGVDKCLNPGVPLEMRAAFTSFAFNLGVGNFCGSRIAALANAGDYAGACRAINMAPDGRAVWVYVKAGKNPDGSWKYKVLPGLVKRRAAERELCEQALKGLRS